jgi:hypothetical protein
MDSNKKSKEFEGGNSINTDQKKVDDIQIDETNKEVSFKTFLKFLVRARMTKMIKRCKISSIKSPGNLSQ